MSTLHVSFDESGDFNFSPRGSRTYVFAIAWTYDPAPLAQDLTFLRFKLLKEGHDIPAFHAQPQEQKIRNQVVVAMCRHTDWQFAALVVEKAKVYPPLREEPRFYGRFATMLMRFVLKGRVLQGTERVLIFTATIPTHEHRRSVEKFIKMSCRAELDRQIAFHC